MLFFLFKHQRVLYLIYALLISILFNLKSGAIVYCEPINETTSDTTSNYLFYTGVALISISSLILLYCVTATSNTNYDFLNLFTKDLYTFTPKEAEFIKATLLELYNQNELVKHQNTILIKTVDQLTNKLDQFEPKDPNIQTILEHIDQYILETVS